MLLVLIDKSSVAEGIAGRWTLRNRCVSGKEIVPEGDQGALCNALGHLLKGETSTLLYGSTLTPGYFFPILAAFLKTPIFIFVLKNSERPPIADLIAKWPRADLFKAATELL